MATVEEWAAIKRHLKQMTTSGELGIYVIVVGEIMFVDGETFVQEERNKVNDQT